MARVYESTTKSYCNGWIITGPDKMYFYSAIVMMFLPEVPFLVTVCPLFVEYISAAIYVISIYFWVFAFYFLFITSFTDPGIIPRGVYNDLDNPFSDHRQPLYKSITIKNIQHEVKWCETCSIFRPPRANHCGICNNCIESFDHHCPWVGNCIGRRNYKFFMYFLFTLGFKCLFVMAFCIAHIIVSAHRIRDDHPLYSSASVFDHALSKSHYLSIILIVYALGGLIFVGSLGGFHCYLISSAQTTNEQIKKSFRKGNPFNKGIIGNFISVFLAPHYPGYYRFTKQKERELMTLNNNNNNNNNGNNRNASNPLSIPSSVVSTEMMNDSSSSASNLSPRQYPLDPTSPV